MELNVSDTYGQIVDVYEDRFSSIVNLEELVSESVENKNNPFAKLALGKIYRSLSPKDEKGVFMLSDGYNLLGMQAQAQHVLEQAFYTDVRSVYIPRRLANQYLSTHSYSKALSFFLENKDKFERFPEMEKEVIKVSILSFDAFRHSEIFGVISNDEDLLSLFRERNSFFVGMCQPSISQGAAIKLISSLIAKDKYELAGRALAALFNVSGLREESFLEKALDGKGRFIRNTEVLDVRRKAVQLYPHNPKLLLSLLEHCIYIGLNDEPYRLIKQYGAECLNACGSDRVLASKLYYMFIRLNRVYGSPSDTLISERAANRMGLTEPRGLELASMQSAVPSIDAERHGACSLISGQIRGMVALEHTLNLPINDLHNCVSTWDYAASTRPRLDTLGKMFPFSARKLIPQEYAAKPTFRQLFPLTIKKLEIEAPKAKKKVSESQLRDHAKIFDCSIEIEEDFESLCAAAPVDIRVSSRFNQAKMYYKMWKSFEKFASGKSYSTVIRIRPDSVVVLDPMVVSDCIEACKRDSSVIFIPYLNEYGYGDQFAIGSYSAMSIYCSAWGHIKNKGFRYSELMEDKSAHGAEEFMANHLLMYGIKVRLMPMVKRLLASDNLGCEVIDVRDEMEADFQKLPSEEVERFAGFVSEFRRFVEGAF